MKNWQVNINNTTPLMFARWMQDRCPDLNWQASKTTSIWEGEVEPGVSVTIWNVPMADVVSFLALYGIEHPNEQCFGMMQLPESTIVTNHAHGTGATTATY